jgi:hypothetical protein
MISTKAGRRRAVNVEVTKETLEETLNSNCLPCNEISENVPCVHFKIHLTGGLSFANIQEQIEKRFDWSGNYPSAGTSYLLPPTSKQSQQF